jgi:heme exporter protein D
MNWASWSDFFAMGGYATYVWGSYLVTFAILAAEIALLRQRGRSARDKIAGYQKRNAAKVPNQSAE